MTDALVVVDGDGPVRQLTLHRPTAKNALSSALLDELAGAVDAAIDDDDVAVLVLGGGPGCFSAGADVREMAALDAASAHAFLARGGELFRRIERAPKPVIASIDGIAAGGGMELALSCTLMVASEGARFGLPEVGLGLIPGLGGTQRLTRAIGRHRAARLMLTGGLVGAADAWDLGLLSFPPVPAAELDRIVLDVAETIASKSRAACGTVLDAIAVATEGSLEGGLALETALAALAIASTDGREGMTAFAEKRPPQFEQQEKRT